MNLTRNWSIWFAVFPVAAWAAIRAFGLDSGYPLEAAMAFTPWVAIAALLIFGIVTALENWAAAAVSGLAMVCLAAAILPRAIGDSAVSGAGHRTLRVLGANVHLGSADPGGIVELVDRLHPDILTMEELTPRLVRELRAVNLEYRLPYHEIDAGSDASGTGIYSRLPLRRLPTADFRSKMARAEATVPGGGRVRIVAVHPYPPDSSESTPEWEEVLATLPSAGRGAPWVLAGDFNATFDQAPFRALVGRGYNDAGEVTAKGLEPTFPQEGHLVPPLTLDHVLADERLGIIEYDVEPLPGSDHRAVFAELALPRGFR